MVGKLEKIYGYNNYIIQNKDELENAGDQALHQISIKQFEQQHTKTEA